METKRLHVEIKNEEEGIVEARFATLGVKDHDGDVIEPGAFGEQRVKVSAYNHQSWGGSLPVGIGTTREKGDEAIADLEFFLGTTHGRDHFETIKGLGELGEWSFGFDVEEEAAPDEEQRQAGVQRILKKLKVFEVSPVLRGAGVGTQTLSVKCDACAAKEGLKDSDRDRNELLRAALQERFGGEGLRIWVADTFSDESVVIYEVSSEEGDDDGLYRVSYEMDDDGTVTFGDPEEVRRITTFEPIGDESERSGAEADEIKGAIMAEVGRYELLQANKPAGL